MEVSIASRSLRLVVAGALLVLAATGLSACTATGSDPRSASVAVSLTDFKISPAVRTAPAGEIRISVYNASPTTHEFVVVRSDLASDQLPLGTDGLSVDEDRVDVVDELGQVDTRTTDTLGLDLAPGRYVFFCNLEGHYLGGMHGALEVSDAQ